MPPLLFMGLFSSKKTFVASQTMPLVLGESDPVAGAVTNAILSGESITGNLLDSALNGIGIRLNRVYRYGQTTYSLGLPEGTFMGISLDLDAIRAILDSRERGEVTITQATLDYGDNQILVNRFLSQTRQLSGDIVGNPPGTLAHIPDTYIAQARAALTADARAIEAGLEGPGTVASIQGHLTAEDELTVRLLSVDATGTNTYQLTYQWTLQLTLHRTFTGTVTTTTVEETETGPVTSTTTTPYASSDIRTQHHTGTESEVWTVPAEQLDLYYAVNYEVSDPVEGTRKMTWTYRVADNTWPQLALSPGDPTDSPFFPIVPIRENNKDLTAEAYRNTEQYITSKRLLKKLDLKIDVLAEKLNENPDVKDIDHAWVFLGFPLDHDDPMVIRYLGRFFDYLGSTAKQSKYAFEQWQAREPVHVPGPEGGYMKTPPLTPPPRKQLRIEDGRLKIELRYNYIDVTLVEGVLGKVGTVERVLTGLDPVTLKDGDPRDWLVKITYDRSYITFREQISPTQYREVVVHGLTHTNYVYGQYTVETNIQDVLTTENHNFLVPMHQGVLQQFSLLKRNRLGSQGLNLILNSVEIVKLKWYQTGFFRFIVTAVALYFGQAQIAQMVQGFTAAAAAGISALATFILNTVLQAAIIKLGLKFAVKLLGDEVALLLAVVAMIYLAGQGLTDGSLPGAPWAEDLLKLTTGLIQEVQGSLQSQLEAVTDASSAFTKEAQDKLDVLKEINDELDFTSVIDPFSFIQTQNYFNPSETPDQFYNRTVHTGNIGVMALDAISHYVDLKLMLPVPEQTIT